MRSLSGCLKFVALCLMAGIVAGCNHDPVSSVELEIIGVPSNGDKEQILEKVKKLTDGSSHYYTSTYSSGTLSVTLSPVSDVEAMVKKVDFGKVESVTGRKVVIRYEPIAGFDIQSMEEASPEPVIENDGGPGAGESEGIPAPAAEVE